MVAGRLKALQSFLRSVNAGLCAIDSLLLGAKFVLRHAPPASKVQHVEGFVQIATSRTDLAYRFCPRDNGLYAPPHEGAWQAIETLQLELEHPDEDTSHVQDLILKLYGVQGLGFDVLWDEIARADALKRRRREASQVLDAWAEGHN